MLHNTDKLRGNDTFVYNLQDPIMCNYKVVLIQIYVLIIM